MNEYEQQRLENIARNQARMKELNLMGAVAAVNAARLDDFVCIVPLPLPLFWVDIKQKSI